MLRYRKWMCALAALVCSPALVLAGQPYPGAPYQSVNPNQQTADQIARILSTSGGLNGQRVYVEFAGGVATLRGQVGSISQRSQAIALTSQVSGVRQVNNQLQVLAPAAPTYHSGVVQAQALAPRSYGVPAAQAAPFALGQFQASPAPTASYASSPTAVNTVNYNLPNVPSYAWPSYAPYPNYASVTYPHQYSPTAWPYIGPFYPYPQVPLGWRKVQLEWDDGWWMLEFDD